MNSKIVYNIKYLNSKRYFYVNSKYLTKGTLPNSEPNVKYICDATNLNIISENIKQRKGKGDIHLVQKLYNEIEQSTKYNKENVNYLKSLFNKEINKIPNCTHPTVLTYGSEPKVVNINTNKINFQYKPKEFHELAKYLNLLRNEHLGGVAGHKGYYFMHDFAVLEQALIKFTLQILRKRQFNIVSVPDILPREIIEKCGMNTKGDRTQVYSLNSSKYNLDLCLSGTAEMALAGYLMNNVISVKDLPLRLAAVSRCYRAETSNVVEERGIYRVHQFTKVEMFGVTEPEKSESLLEEYCKIQEENFEMLGLHYQTLDMPAHELGAPAYRKYDIEAWMPGRNMYGEVSSCSDCTDYQSRRLNIKYDNSGELDYVHTINGTACAIPRMLIAIVETYQQENGTILIPSVLQPFMNGNTVIRKQKKVPQLKLVKT